jgi:hypothetical protein
VTADELLKLVPEAQRQAASALVAQYGPRLLEMAASDAWAYIRRLQAGDIMAAADLDAKLSDDQWLAGVATNTAAWEAVANYNVVRQGLRNEFLLRVAPLVLTILLALVGL